MKTLQEISTTLPVLLVTKAAAARRLPRFQAPYVTHEGVGGVTTWKGKAWVRDWVMKPHPQTVKQNIGHILIHSNLPRPRQSDPAFRHLNPGDLYPVEGSSLPVVFPTHGTYSNWGHRRLSDKEVAYMFDLPVWLANDDDQLKSWTVRCTTGVVMPLKPLQAMTQLFLESLPVESLDELDVPVAQASPFVASTFTWFPLLGKRLSHSWANPSSVSDKAVKSDDASVAFAIWDKRVSLVLKWSANNMTALWGLAFGRWQRSLRREFQAVMMAKYGPRWLEKVLAGRRRRLVSPVRGESVSQLSLTGGLGVFKGMKEMSRTERSARAKARQAVDQVDSELLHDADIGCEALSNVLDSTWWEWSNGSSLLFWRWNSEEQRRDARDGMEIFVRGELPGFFRKPRPMEFAKLRLIASKIGTVRRRTYIRAGPIRSLIDFFDVPKGDDIRMVYNGTSSGLNDALWAPSFFLPSAESAGRLLTYNSYCVDMDLGEMLLNFPMDVKLRPYAGVNLTRLAPLLDDKAVLDSNGRLFERWERLFMGMRPSPYNAVRYFYWAEEFARGKPTDPKYAIRYDRVILNLPGGDSFDPTLPMVMKWNDKVDRLAGDVVTFVDDLRATGHDSANAWQVARQVASRLEYLGIQDAPRKRRPSTQKPGAWAGCVFKIFPDKIAMTVTQEKWDKTKTLVKSIAEKVLGGDPLPDLHHKELESQRGFLVHLTMTFSSMVPFLKGIHLTLDSWREGRKDDGWKMTPKEWRLWSQQQAGGDEDQQDLVYLIANDGAPVTVKPVPRLASDIRALSALLSQDTPPLSCSQVKVGVSRPLWLRGRIWKRVRGYVCEKSWNLIPHWNLEPG